MLRTNLYLPLLVAIPFIAQAATPSAYIDTLSPGQSIGGSVTVAGWAIDNTSAVGTLVAGVQIAVDGTVVGNANYGIYRGDVCGAYPNRPGCPNVGFTYTLNTASLTNGSHTVSAIAVDTDTTPDSGSYSVTVTVNNGPPTVVIDSLTPGQSISGNVTVAGWAIDNASAPISPIGSVEIRVDGIAVGAATYGIQRLDVCGVYPGRPNCPNVGFIFQLNPTAARLSAGTHTITAVAFDTDPSPESASYSVSVQLSSGTTASTTTLAAPSSPSPYLAPLKLGATIAPGSGAGVVTFEDGGVVLGTVSQSAGQASLTTSQLGSGTRSLRAFFSGSSTAAPSSSTVVSQLVKATSSSGFASPATSSASQTARGTFFAAGDFNGDGKPDLAVAAGTAATMLGNGNGTFQSAVTLPSSPTANFVAVGDFNVDGKLDIVTGGPNGGFVYLGNGDGTFLPKTSYTVPTSVTSLVIGDFNRDGKPDFAVANNSRISVYLGNGDGTFTSPLNSPSEFATTSLVLADVNADGIPDLAGIGSNDVDIFIGNGDGTFSPYISYADLLTPNALAVADLNSDGKADIVIANNANSVTVLLNNGDGSFKIGDNFPSGFLPASIAVGDFNGDGKTDVVTCNGLTGSLFLLSGSGDGTFSQGTLLSFNSVNASSIQYSQVLTGDFNGDGRLDILGLGHPSLLQTTTFVDAYLAISTAPPTVFIDSLASGASVYGTVTIGGWAIDPSTAIASVQIQVDGNVVGNATYGTQRGDVCAVYPGRIGCPNVGFTYQLNATALLPGPHTITAVATDLDSTPLTSSYSINITVPQAVPPTVFLDSLAPGASVSGTITLYGWALDPATRVSGVQVKVDGSPIGTATYGINRVDVCAVYPGRPGCPNVGFSFQLNTASLLPGSHTLTVIATNTDAVPLSASYSIPITVVYVAPSVFIDGANLSGGVATITGWALDTATPIAQVQILVDGASVGNATYGVPRGDVCAVYPGRPGCPNVGFSIQINTAPFPHGPHSITAVATNNDNVPQSASYSTTVQF